MSKATATREYDCICRMICMVKHGNPMALGETSIVLTDDAVQIAAGPHFSPVMRRIANTAAEYALRYTLLVLTLYLSLLPSEIRSQHMSRLLEFEACHASFVRDADTRLADGGDRTKA